MKPTPFNPEDHLPPIPFGDRHLQMAASLKDAGLVWTPHVGCFVWDRDHCLPVASPFPADVYFILNLGHFLRLLGSVEEVGEKLIWLPTWHQARMLCEKVGVRHDDVLQALTANGGAAAGEDLMAIYALILEALRAGTG